MVEKLPEAYLARMRAQLGGEFAAYLRAMEEPPPRTLRVNAGKIAPEAFERLADFPLTPVPEAPACYRFPNEVAIGRHPLHLAGLCYVQEPSAQQPVRLLGVEPGMTVLDLCAAPGGKSGQIAERLKGAGLLIANEPVPARARALQSNLERLGVTNAVITNQYPETVCAALAGRCDAVLVDAPCSGEGMFRREPDAITGWSEAHVQSCAERQRHILDSAAEAVKPGGALVYATCTFSAAEDEETVRAFLSAHPDFALVAERKLYPHMFPGEGQYLARLTRRLGPEGNGDSQHAPTAPGKRAKQNRPAGSRKGEKPGELAPFEAFWKAYLTRPAPRNVTLLRDGRVMLLPEGYFSALDGLRILRAGVLAGELRDGRFTPVHALFAALPPDAFFSQVTLADEALLRYLSGETVACDAALSGWCAVCWEGFCVGFGKAVSGVLKNHLPKGLRV